MTIEELLQRRYEVLTAFPGSIEKEGDIILANPENAKECELYPKIYAKLDWWDRRSLEDLSSVKYIKLYWSKPDKIGYVHKVEKWEGYNLYNQPLYTFLNIVGNASQFCVLASEPATEEEYNNYIKSKQ